VESCKTSIAVEDRFKVVPFEEFCEIAHVGHSRGYEFLNSGDVKSVLVGRRRLVLVQSWYDYLERLLEEQRTFTPGRHPASRQSPLSELADPPPAEHRHRRDAEAARVNIRPADQPIRPPRLPISAEPILGAASSSAPFRSCAMRARERAEEATVVMEVHNRATEATNKPMMANKERGGVDAGQFGSLASAGFQFPRSRSRPV